MMYLNKLMEQHNMTRADLCRKSGLPDSTLRDILSGKAQIDHCKAGTLLLLADALDTTVEEIIDNYLDEALEEELESEPEELHDSNSLIDFYTLVKMIRRIRLRKGDIAVMHEICRLQWIEKLFTAGAYRCALFLLGFVDYLCTEHNLDVPERYNSYRGYWLDQPVYPVELFNPYNDDPDSFDLGRNYNQMCAIPELARFGIYMTEYDISPKE